MRDACKAVAAAALLLLGATSPANAQSFGNNVPPDFPNPENVRVSGDSIVWDAVEGAAGYNIYFTDRTERGGLFDTPLTYIDTVRGATRFPLEFTGNYSVVSFNQDASLFSNQFSPSVRVRYEAGTSVAPSSPGVFSVTCGNVGGGESCTASCPSAPGGTGPVATGGACSTSDFVPVNATAEERSYSCAVQTFSGEVRAQVYCYDP